MENSFSDGDNLMLTKHVINLEQVQQAIQEYEMLFYFTQQRTDPNQNSAW